jgi:putative transposase
MHRSAEAEPEHAWQKRFYDCNVYSERKRVEKLRYIHRNPVKRGLVESPDEWAWSSFRAYAYREQGPVSATHPSKNAQGGLALLE